MRGFKTVQSVFTALALGVSCVGQANILVLEYDDGVTDFHGQYVASVACGERLEKCMEFYFTDLHSQERKNEVLKLTSQHPTVNMSFGFEYANETPEGHFREGYAERVQEIKASNAKMRKVEDFLSDLVSQNPETFFVAAAGNGRALGSIGLQSKGIYIDDTGQEVIPAIFDDSNLITVTATNQTPLSATPIEEVMLADYANFSLWFVDVAAPVPFMMDANEKEVKGTSFAAPWVSQVGDEMRERNPLLSPTEAKEILLKSCDVKNIDAAIAASQDWLDKGRDSLTYRTTVKGNRKKRAELLKELGDILLVKSGGVVNKDLAQTCADLYASGFGTITESCLAAHDIVKGESPEGLEKLKTLWNLRGF